MNTSSQRRTASGDLQASEEAVVAVRCTLLASLLESFGVVEDIRRRLREQEISRRELHAQATQRLARILHGQAASFSDEMRERIIELVLDALDNEPLCPEVRLPLAAGILPELPVHALVFSAFPHAANELYPLMVDAYVADLETAGRRTFQVVGVHESWLVNGSFRRALIFSEEDQGLVEADIAGTPMIRSAQVLALDLRDEHAAHRRIEAALPGVRVVNPCTGAEKLDDKCWTGACWQQAGLPTPRFIVLQPGANWQDALTRFASGQASLVLKPVDGTEGRGVSIIRNTNLPSSLQEPLLAMADYDSIRYMTESGPVRCTVRLNICWDGHAAHVESGYAQVASDREAIASAGRGGRVVSLQNLWSQLYRRAGSSFIPTKADWQDLLDTASAGATALADALGGAMPGLIGLDLLLDLDAHGSLQPVLLEANPRPSGMCHSRYLTTDEPGVTEYLWKAVSGTDTATATTLEN